MKALLAAPMLALLLPCTAPAQELQTPGSKILVMECNPHRHSVGQAHPWIDPYGNWHYSPAAFPYWDAFLAITYENRAPLVATEIDFGLFASGSLIAVARDVGKFSPNVKIDHEFVVSREIFPLSATPSCAVFRVKYADGSVWQNPLSEP